MFIDYKPIDKSSHKEYGTFNDSILKRLKHNLEKNKAPLIRAHVGPYFSNKSRIESVTEFGKWAETLARTKYLDIYRYVVRNYLNLILMKTGPA